MGGGPGKEKLRYRWEEGGFYAVLTARVKRHFLEKHGYEGADPRQSSVNRFVKVGNGMMVFGVLFGRGVGLPAMVVDVVVCRFVGVCCGGVGDWCMGDGVAVCGVVEWLVCWWWRRFRRW